MGMKLSHAFINVADLDANAFLHRDLHLWRRPEALDFHVPDRILLRVVLTIDPGDLDLFDQILNGINQSGAKMVGKLRQQDGG